MNLSEMWQSKTVKIVTVVVAAIAIGLGVWSIMDASGSSPEWLPSFPGSTAQQSADASGSATTDQTPAKSDANVTPTANETDPGADNPATPGADDPAAAPDNPAVDPAKPAVDPAKPVVPGETMNLRVLLWNDTDAKAPKSLEVAVGAVKWVPADPTVPSQTGELAGLAVGKKLSFDVYPDGRSGKKATVTILLTKDMRSGSEADAVHVEIRDGSVRVLGTPVENFDVGVERY